MNRRDWLKSLLAAVVPSSVLADEATYWRARVQTALAIQEAESNPWLPPVPPKAPELPPQPKTGVKVDLRPIIYRLTATWCAPCRALGASLTKDVRDKLPFQIVDWDVDQKGYMGAPTIPAFWWKSPQGNRRVSWNTIEHLVKTWEATQKPVAKATANNGYPAFSGYRPRWTWPRGVNLQDHLRQSHGVSESLTQDQAERLHDALHEGHSLQAIRNHFR